MEEPPKKRDLSNVEEVVPFACIQILSIVNENTTGMKGRTRFHVNVFPLLPGQVKPEKKYRDEQADGRSYPDQRCADEVVLELAIAPTTHTKSKVLEWPVERRGRQDVELVWVGDQSVV